MFWAIPSALTHCILKKNRNYWLYCTGSLERSKVHQKKIRGKMKLQNWVDQYLVCAGRFWMWQKRIVSLECKPSLKKYFIFFYFRILVNFHLILEFIFLSPVVLIFLNSWNFLLSSCLEISSLRMINSS